MDAEGLLGQALFLARHFQLAGGVGAQGVLAHQVLEQILERAEAAALGGDAQRHAVLLAPAPEVALIAFEDGFGDGGRLCQVALVRPQQEDFEGVPAALDGVGRVVAHGEALEIAGGFVGEAAGKAGGQLVGVVAAALVLVALAQAAGRLVSFFAGHGGGLLVRCYLLSGKTEDKREI